MLPNSRGDLGLGRTADEEAPRVKVAIDSCSMNGLFTFDVQRRLKTRCSLAPLPPLPRPRRVKINRRLTEKCVKIASGKQRPHETRSEGVSERKRVWPTLRKMANIHRHCNRVQAAMLSTFRQAKTEARF